MTQSSEPDESLCWFGPSWQSEGNELFPHVDVPAGHLCDGCNKAFRLDDQGVQIPSGLPGRDGFERYHRQCWGPSAATMDSEFDEFGPA